MDALIGHSGYVGSTLLRQRTFDRLYRSFDIANITDKKFQTVVCAGAPSQKWIANRDPANDLRNLAQLMDSLGTVTCDTFILISTVDVFGTPIGVDEDSHIAEVGLHAYGRHRRALETFVQDHFSNHLIVRLPGLVGPGLRKNVIFDLLNGNNLHAIDSRGRYQFYPMVNLWYDIQKALEHRVKLIHLTAEPITVSDIAEHAFGRRFDETLANPPATYDMRTRFAALFDADGSYQYSRRETIQAIRAYAQSEPRTTSNAAKT